MQLRTRRLAIIIAGTLLSSVGLVLAACSTDNGTTPLPGQTTDASRRETSTGSSGGDDEQDGEAPEDDAGTPDADCREAPRLRSNDRGFFCAFLPRDAGAGGGQNCGHDETCCNPAEVGGQFPTTFCASTPRDEKGGNGETACADQAAAKGSTWTAGKGTTWECGDKNNCDDGQVCCLFTQPGLPDEDEVNIGDHLNKDIPKACNAKQAFKYGGTKCAAACGDKEIQLCSNTDQNCQGGKTCYPFEVVPGGRNLAYCR